MNKWNEIALVASLGILAGCPKEDMVKVEYRDVYVPVATVPQPPDVPKPTYEYPKLTPQQKDDIGVVTKALVEDTKRKDGYINILELIINTYKQEADKSKVQTTLEVPGLTDKPAQ